MSPWALMQQLMTQDLDRLLRTVGGGRTTASQAGQGVGVGQSMGQGTGLAGPGAADVATWVPEVEVQQRPNEVVVRADLPGMKADEIDVSIEDEVLTISGERRQEQREEDAGVIRTERVYGTFLRTIPLPDGVDESQVMATFRDGVLEIRIPVTRRERGRRIDVKS